MLYSVFFLEWIISLMGIIIVDTTIAGKYACFLLRFPESILRPRRFHNESDDVNVLETSEKNSKNKPGEEARGKGERGGDVKVW